MTNCLKARKQTYPSIPAVVLAAGALLATFSPAFADPLGTGSGTVFRLTPGASYQEGCFPPCKCPMLEQRPVRGAFKLRYVGSGNDGIQNYAVEDVNWKVSFGGERRILGSGKYRIGSPHLITVLEQRMELDLQVDAGPIEHFDSGWVPIETNSGIRVTVSINNMFCHDRVITIDAQSVPSAEVVPYALGPGATFQRTCFDPCDCAPGDPRPMMGTFALVPVADNSLVRDYAIVDIQWFTAALDASHALPIAGIGWYTVGGEVAAQHRMVLDLAVGDEPGQHFDSGPIAGGASFPFIDVIVSLHGMVCFDTVLHVVAGPKEVQICGGIAYIPCDDPDEFCNLPMNGCCCDFQGICTPIPGACPEYYDPVCGCDGVTYGNECFAAAAAMSIDHRGSCGPDCRPADNGFGCVPAACSTTLPAVQCIPSVLQLDLATGAITTAACECLDFNVCHIEFGNASPFAVGHCPGDGTCTVIARDTNGDGIDDWFTAGCEPTGACCSDVGGSPLPVPICSEVPAEVCEHGGLFQGPGTTCEPHEACCMIPGNAGYCIDISPACCLTFGGVPHGPGSTCADPAGQNPCTRSCGGFTGHRCNDGEFCKFPEGICSDAADHTGVCTPIPSGCPDVWDPVCGCDGRTYGNECDADAASVSIQHRGPCEAGCGGPNDPPCAKGQFCKFPNGVCDAAIRGGFCTPIPGECIALWNPVCGCDGRTYGNECEADAASVSIQHRGPCEVPACPAARGFSTPEAANLSYCPGVQESVFIALSPPTEANALALEDSPPPGWVVTDISNGGTYDATNNKVKWGPFYPPFPDIVSYAVVPGNDTAGRKCFAGTVSVDGLNRPICGEDCLDPCCPHVPPDEPQPICEFCPVGDCGSCGVDSCGDGQVSLCEVTGYACAWLRGCNDDLSGMTRAAYLWRNGECYCWDHSARNWFSAPCSDVGEVCCPAENPAPAISSAVPSRGAVGHLRPLTSSRSNRAEYELAVSIDAPSGTSAVALEVAIPGGWKVLSVADSGVYDTQNRKIKWGPYFDDAPRTVTARVNLPVSRTTAELKSGRLAISVDKGAMRGKVCFDGASRLIMFGK